MSASGLVGRAWDGAVARMTLARPPLNIMTIPMMQELNGALDEAAARPGLKCVLIEATGVKALALPVDLTKRAQVDRAIADTLPQDPRRSTSCSAWRHRSSSVSGPTPRRAS